MRFLHDEPDFGELLGVVSRLNPARIGPALIEKDYWVTHALWSLQHQGFELWFKGGTSLSKGFGLVQRFSEDLDLKLEAGSAKGIPAVENWKSTGTRAVVGRRRFFEAIESRLEIPSCTIVRPGRSDDCCRERVIQVLYPGAHLGSLLPVMRPFVQLELGSARVVPAVERELDSWVHQHARSRGWPNGVADNRPVRLRCVHPLVTLVEKLEALSRRFSRENADPAGYVRHYEDAACIIRNLDTLPALEQSPRQLIDAMVSTGDLKAAPRADDPAYHPREGARWAPTLAAYRAIGSMHWGKRQSLTDACVSIRSWLAAI